MKSKLSVEDYIQFLSSHKQRPLTINFLNQIISIHGFKKLTKHKKELSDAVETLDLMDLSRSTLKSSISSNAWLTEKEVIGDLNCLEWQECCVTSIQALNSSPLADQQSNPKPQAKRKRGNTEGADSFSSALLSLQSS
ncbi:hypothetical protein ERO13_A09G001600v2 [Gossypium hirsutum]|uniref:DUF7787 domain-containing protein n=5 Tax=Gossypium TaxID=3633 RepID=A0A1U8HVW5_GOSHI|nr:uncharacterized protein LOC107890176 [Gossypium hirsutum]KAB2064162.1 hypothetical protein ES319_A09G001800v1 [Gossypium barbadense]TYH00741.1 hypothetical protein ES288_A09G002800v1 [Gossypium darwinii]TYI08444.1 hypothetical protein ES332_A09G002000v1 [Gossypium tomentosum]TYJ16711.1 hypothetical protein E1A91_A09G001600v1 [Gossypium mustelinum]KAG4181730.1 hypothetical protein ERO13_A09G001600v2 [Gossypium hirsutum]